MIPHADIFFEEVMGLTGLNIHLTMFPERTPLDELTDPNFQQRHPRLHAKLVDLQKRGHFRRKGLVYKKEDVPPPWK